jgi:hypothetical protein
MKHLCWIATLVTMGAATVSSGAGAQEAIRIAGTQCDAPPVQHCPDANCPGDRVINQGSVVEMKTRRTYFLDYPCDLKKDEKVTFVLSLHGGGSYGNWMRHYFPLVDYKDQYRLVIATPHAPTRAWAEADDDYLRNIVDFVYAQMDRNDVEVRAFWLVGHSQGGQTSNRLLYTNFYGTMVDGWVSLSGGRLGSKRSDVRAAIPGPGPAALLGPNAPPRPAGPPGAARGGAQAGNPGLVADASVLPKYSFSHIYVTGEHELTPAGMPDNSRWADKLKCGARTRRDDVVDTKAGYVYDTTRQNPSNPIWGSLPRPGKAQIYAYPKCEGGRTVADIIRMDKGHTEGYEPRITEEIIKMMLATKK